MAKKKTKSRQGHYCRICDSYKANEQFTGKGHRQHICKKCQALPKDTQEDRAHINKEEPSGFNVAQDRRINLAWDTDSDALFPAIYDADLYTGAPIDSSSSSGPDDGAPLCFSALDKDIKTELLQRLEDRIESFIIRKNYLPASNHLGKITKGILNQARQTVFFHVIPDSDYFDLVQKTLQKISKQWAQTGNKLKTYQESLIVLETERLIIRKLTQTDYKPLLAIMGKPAVMYAWEHGFTGKEVHKWINKQFSRYSKDGFGYYSVILKENGALIGQAGLIRSVINRATVVEIGYLLDDDYWHQGYGLEAARSCLQYGFEQLNLTTLFCSIRPENVASIRLAECLGMALTGSHIVHYKKKEMPHLIYKVEKQKKT